MDGVFGGRWLCIAGRNFSAELTPGAQRFALFRTPAYAVTVFQLPHVLRPVNEEIDEDDDLPALSRFEICGPGAPSGMVRHPTYARRFWPEREEAEVSRFAGPSGPVE